MMPRSKAWDRARPYRRNVVSPSHSISSPPTISAPWSKLMFSSWPVSALVEGVNRGASSRSLFRKPAGRGMPHTEPLAW